MDLCSCSRKVFLFFVLTNYGVLSDNTNASTEEDPAKDSMFADVIKNITRVNTVLQDLIKNYEKLQKIYKSQETIESYSTEEEHGGELFRGRNKKLKRHKTDEKSTTKILDFPATKMYVSSEELTDNERKKTKASKVPKAKYLKTVGKGNKATTENEIVSDESSDEYDEEESKKNKTKPTKKRNKLEKETKKVLPNTMQFSVNKDTTYNNTKTNAQTEVTPAKQTIKTLKKQIIQSEKFSENNIWTEIVNKPVNLQKEKEIIYSKRKAQKNDVSFRTEMDKNIAANVSKKQMIKDNVTLTSESVEEDKTIQKEQFKTAILRKAYGDACLKVVVKKCYKACKRVIQDSCSRYTCKSNFKMSFKEHSKTGCIKEFKELDLKEKMKTDDPVRIRADAGSDFLDITRNGYLAAACLPNSKIDHVIGTKSQRRGDSAPAKRAQTELDKKLNILRDRFERACQETSSNKCNAACEYALEETCSVHECHKKKKADLKKTCKKSCKQAYRSGKSSGSDSDSSASGSSESSESDSNSSNDKPTTKRGIKIKTTTLKKKIIIKPTTQKSKIRIHTTTKREIDRLKKQAAHDSDSEDYENKPAERKPQPKEPPQYKEKTTLKAEKETKENRKF